MGDLPPECVLMHAKVYERINLLENHVIRDSEQMDRVEKSIKDNTDLTVEVRDILSTAKGTFKAFAFIGKAAKWVGGLAAAASAVYVLYQVLFTGALPIIKIL
jgi:hypothetical protein